jgi:hypothetical protein
MSVRAPRRTLANTVGPELTAAILSVVFLAAGVLFVLRPFGSAGASGPGETGAPTGPAGSALAATATPDATVNLAAARSVLRIHEDIAAVAPLLAAEIEQEPTDTQEIRGLAQRLNPVVRTAGDALPPLLADEVTEDVAVALGKRYEAIDEAIGEVTSAGLTDAAGHRSGAQAILTELERTEPIVQQLRDLVAAAEASGSAAP